MSSSQQHSGRSPADSRASASTTANGTGPTSPSKQDQKPSSSSSAPPRQSCTACRARKIKCNKALPHCAQCQRAGSNCFYAASQRRGRPRNGTAPSQPLTKEAQLEKRVRQLEAIIASLRGSSGAADPSSTESLDPLQAQLGKLVIGKPYLNDSFWMSEELNDILGDTTESSDESDDEVSTGNSPHSSNQDFILGQVPNIENLMVLHPPVDQILGYWNTYLENCESFLRLIHTPTMDAMVRRAVQTDLHDITTSDELLLFCFYFAATTSLPDDDCLQQFGCDKDILLQKYQIGIKHALARAKFMHSQDFKVLQGLVLYLTCVKHTDDAHGAIAWTMCGLAIRLAQSIGVDRDGTLFKLSPLDTEMRRRVWWQLLLSDLRASESRGTMSTLLRFDTKLPTHINDTDIDENTTEYPKARKGPCDMTISLVRLEIAMLGRRVQGSGADDVPIPLPAKKKMIEEFSKKLSEKYFHPNEHSSPMFQYSYRTACLITARMNLMIHVRKKDLAQEERDWLFQIAIEMMEHTEELKHNILARKWGWLLKTNVQWHAVAFALAELCIRESSPQVDRAWRIVEKARFEWTAPADSASIPLYQSVKKLLAKAEKNRRSSSMSQRGSQGSSPMSFSSFSQPTPTHSEHSDDTLSAGMGMARQLQPQMPPHMQNIPLHQQGVYNWVEMVPNMPQYSPFVNAQWATSNMDAGFTSMPDQMSGQPSQFYTASGPPMAGPHMAMMGMGQEQSWPWDQMLSSSDAVSGIQVTAPQPYIPMPNPPQWPVNSNLSPEQAARAQNQQWNG